MRGILSFKRQTIINNTECGVIGVRPSVIAFGGQATEVSFECFCVSTVSSLTLANRSMPRIGCLAPTSMSRWARWKSQPSSFWGELEGGSTPALQELS